MALTVLVVETPSDWCLLYDTVCCDAVLPAKSMVTPALCISVSAASPYVHVCVVLWSFVCPIVIVIIVSFNFLALRLCFSLGFLCRLCPSSWTYNGFAFVLFLSSVSALFVILFCFTSLGLSFVWSYRGILLLVHHLDISHD